MNSLTSYLAICGGGPSKPSPGADGLDLREPLVERQRRDVGRGGRLGVGGARDLDEVAEEQEVARAEAHLVHRGHRVAHVALGERPPAEADHDDDADRRAAGLDRAHRLDRLLARRGLADEGQQRIVPRLEADVHPAEAAPAQFGVVGRRSCAAPVKPSTNA